MDTGKGLARVYVAAIISFCAIAKFPEGPFDPAAGQFSWLANTGNCTPAKGCRDLIEPARLARRKSPRHPRFF